MNIILSNKPTDSDITILPLFAGQASKINLPSAAIADFKNSLGAIQIVYSENSRNLLLGLGEKKSFSPKVWRTAIHSAVNAIQNLDVRTANLYLPKENLMELTGFALTFAGYRFDSYKTDKKVSKLDQIEIIAPSNKRNLQFLAQGIIIGKAANNTRNLANHPGNVATPAHLARHAQALAKQYKFRCEILGPKEITKEKLGLLEGVAKGSEEPPRFIILELKNSKKAPIVLIGKGLTFDSGGISIKPADKMEEMKYDMCGAADVLGIFEAAAALKLPLHLIGLIPASENLLSGRAIKPGDILTAHNGATVEIVNTDAEGRLVIADALSFAQKYYQPRLVIDYATLTGAVVQALGDEYAGYFANMKTFDAQLKKSASVAAEQFWNLPLALEYADSLKSTVADIKNVGEKGVAGAISAALFLQHFVKNISWIHLDIAGTAWTTRNKSQLSAGATAWGVYLTVEFLRDL